MSQRESVLQHKSASERRIGGSQALRTAAGQQPRRAAEASCASKQNGLLEASFKFCHDSKNAAGSQAPP